MRQPITKAKGISQETGQFLILLRFLSSSPDYENMMKDSTRKIF